MIRNGEVRVYPDGTKCGRLYGSWKLPEIDSDDVRREILRFFQDLKAKEP